VPNVGEVRQIEVHSAEPLVRSHLEVETAIAKLKNYKSPDNDHISAVPVNHKHINSIWNKEELPDQWKESSTVPVQKKGNKTDC
jgi:hypothetical protein